MAITVTCACGKSLEAFDELIGQNIKCGTCGGSVQIPLSAPKVVAAAAVAGDSKSVPCYLCKVPVPNDAPCCSKCGWDRKRTCRCCIDCGDPILLEAGGGLSGAAVNGAAGVLALTSGLLGGFLGALAVGCGMAAIGNTYRGFTLRYRCGTCKQEPRATLLTSHELEELRGSRIMALVSGGVLAVISVIAALIWVFVVLAARRKA